MNKIIRKKNENIFDKQRKFKKESNEINKGTI